MPYANLGEFDLYYDLVGRGAPVFFLHGFTLDHRMWQPQKEQLIFMRQGQTE